MVEKIRSLISPQIKLDLKDMKILFELDFNARAPNSEIARKVGLSKQTVDYKIKNMIKKRIIDGFFPVINNQKLGYFYGRLFIKLHNLTEEKEKQIIGELKQNKKVNWLLTGEGAIDLFVATWAKTLGEFKKFSTEILSKYGLYIKEIRESVGIELVHFKPRFLLGSKSTEKISTTEEKEVEVIIDALDKEILLLICENARAPLVEIAKKLNTSSKLVAYRLKRMEEKEIIVGYRININYTNLGYIYYKILFSLTNVTAEKFLKFRSFFESNPKVIYIVDAIGPANFDAELIMRSQREYFDFMHEVRFNFPDLIKEYEPIIVGETFKVTFLPHDL